jgi:cytochrome c-type biogenesis protein CcmH
MSLTPLGWLLVLSSISLLALVAFSLRLDEAGLALLSRLRSSGWGFGEVRRGAARTSMVCGAVFLLVAGIGAAVSYLRHPAEATGDRAAQAHSAANSEMLARLKDYTRSIGNEHAAPASTAAPGKPLPDVETMIARLATRLETTPGDVKGWRMLGWSYFNTGRYKLAATAYAKAVALDPNSTELKASYDEAKAKSSVSNTLETASSVPSEPAGTGVDGTRGEADTTSGRTTPRGRDAFIRSMVDGLADRLEKSPRDVEGWARLMRSRVVLGEREAATTALRKALEVFKDDSTATDRIMAAAVELGLRAE